MRERERVLDRGKSVLRSHEAVGSGSKKQRKVSTVAVKGVRERVLWNGAGDAQGQKGGRSAQSSTPSAPKEWSVRCDCTQAVNYDL